MTSTTFLLVFAGLYFTHLALELFLDVLNLKHMDRFRRAPPPFIEDLVTPESYERSIAYTRAKTHFSIVVRLASAAFIWTLILTGTFGLLDEKLDQPLAYPIAIGLILYLFQLPFNYYKQFSLEARFGFNKSTHATFVIDQIKSILLALAFGIPLLLAFYYFMDVAGSYWWLFAFLVFMGFQLLSAAIFPVFLAPLFYKFTPLSDSSLSQKIIELAQRIRFKMAGVFSIDGSRRSAHSNAFFAGMGKTRRVVLFDTLMQNLTEDEIVAVIAHEMGHDKLKHIQRRLLLSTAGSLVGFYALSVVLKWPAFYEAFGVAQPKNYVGLVLFALFAGVVTFPLQPLFQALSRKHEYEADAFSVETTSDRETLKHALKKLAKDNLSNLTPHPWYSFFHYSHPAIAERIAAIDKHPIH